MSRRSSGEGTVYKTPSGRWAAMLELPRHPDGRRNRKMRRARTQAEAQRLLSEMRREFEDNGSVSSKNRMLTETIADYLGLRLGSKAKRKTLERDRLFARRLSVLLAKRKTSDLTVSDCDRLLEGFATGENTATGDPVSRPYITRVRSFLTAALRNDMRLGYISRNVAELAVVPETVVKKKPRRSLSVEEWNQLYEGSQETTQLIVDLGGRHGLRPQEIRSVHWPDIDLGARTISVVTQQDSYDEPVDPKTNNSTRTIGLHPETIELLEHWRARQQQLREKAGSVWRENNLVITTGRGTAIQRHNQRRSVHGLCAKLDIERITPYELRHTAISQQIEADHSLTHIAEWAGTSVKMIQDHYRHKLRAVSMVPPVEMTPVSPPSSF